jgi:hypothetical protein
VEVSQSTSLSLGAQAEARNAENLQILSVPFQVNTVAVVVVTVTDLTRNPA